MNPARFSVERSVLVHLLFLISILAGIFALSELEIDVFPNISFAQAKINTTWLGASAQDVEQFVTKKIEEEVERVQGIDRVVSHSQADLSVIDVKFREDITEAQYEKYFNDLRSSLERVKDLPEEAEKPILQEQTVNEIYPMITVVITTTEDAPADDAGRRELIMRAVAKEIRRRLQEVEGVLRVTDFPIRDREYQVVVDPGRLRRHGLAVLEVHAAIRDNHLNLPAGPLAGEGQEISVRSVGEYLSPESLLDLEISRSGGGPRVRLSDVARVEDGFARRTYLSRYDGRQSLALGVLKSEGADSLTLRRGIEATLVAFRAEGLPDGLEILTAIDTTKVIKSRIGVLRTSLLFGVVLVFFILWLFVGARNSFLAVLGVPFSFLFAVIFLEPMGITINAISLFSMVLVSGMIVDDAIIVIENIYRHVERGVDLRTAVIEGTREVTWPVMAATATTVAAFLPMLLMEGVVGVFLSIIPKTVVACLIGSVVECFFILPAHYLAFGPSTGRERGFDRRFDRFRDGYVRLLRRALLWPKTVVGLCLAALVVALALVGSIPVNLFPSDFQAFYVNLTLPPHYSLAQTAAATSDVEALLHEHVARGDAEAFTTSVGVTWTSDNQLLLQPNVAQILVSISDEVANDGDPEELINRIRGQVAEFVDSGRSRHAFVGAEVDSFQDGPPIGKPVAVRIRSHDYTEGEVVGRRVMAELGALPGVFGIRMNLEPGPEELRIVPERERLATYGVPFRTVALTARAANDGLVAGTVKDPESDDEIDIRVRLASTSERTLDAVADADVRLPSGATVRVGDLAELEVGRSYLSRYHYDTQRTVLVTADLDTAVTSSDVVNRTVQARLGPVGAEHPGVVLAFGGEFEETQRSFRSLGRAFVIALLLIYTILAAQFRSYLLPVIIISAVPLAIIGVIFGLKVLGLPFTITTAIAIVGLAGIAVNDSLVLVEFVEKSRREGMALVDAIARGCDHRLRAIILTTATTVFGLLPMALELTGKSKVWSPFAATLSFGLGVASFLTLFFVPAVYLLVNRRFRTGPRDDVDPAPRGARGKTPREPEPSTPS